MKKYNFTFAFLPENKLTVGFDYSKGIMTNPDGEQGEFKEFLFGFLFGYFSMYIFTNKKGEN